LGFVFPANFDSRTAPRASLSWLAHDTDPLVLRLSFFTSFVWGPYRGLLLVGERVLDPRQQWRPSAIAGTVLVMIGWVFRTTDLGSALAYLRAMLFLGHGTVMHFPLRYYPAGRYRLLSRHRHHRRAPTGGQAAHHLMGPSRAARGAARLLAAVLRPCDRAARRQQLQSLHLLPLLIRRSLQAGAA
jgi:hypothetical protein